MTLARENMADDEIPNSSSPTSSSPPSSSAEFAESSFDDDDDADDVNNADYDDDAVDILTISRRRRCFKTIVEPDDATSVLQQPVTVTTGANPRDIASLQMLWHEQDMQKAVME